MKLSTMCLSPYFPFSNLGILPVGQKLYKSAEHWQGNILLLLFYFPQFFGLKNVSTDQYSGCLCFVPLFFLLTDAKRWLIWFLLWYGTATYDDK